MTDFIAPKAKNIYYLALYRKKGQPLPWGQTIAVPLIVETEAIGQTMVQVSTGVILGQYEILVSELMNDLPALCFRPFTYSTFSLSKHHLVDCNLGRVPPTRAASS